MVTISIIQYCVSFMVSSIKVDGRQQIEKLMNIYRET